MSARRDFVLACGKAAAGFIFMAACEQERLLKAKPRTTAPSFFGHMVQGDWVGPGGQLSRPVTVYIGLLRLWDSGAVWKYMAREGPNGIVRGPDGVDRYELNIPLSTALEDNISYASRIGAEIMFTFGRPPVYSVVKGTDNVPTPEAWEGFVRQTVAEARGRIKYWELWNEPAYPEYWSGTPEELVEQSRVAYQIIKELQSDAVVLSPSFTRVELPDGQAFLKQYIAAGGLRYCDAVAWHGYAGAASDLAGQIAALRSLVGYRPIWNTEYVVGIGLSQMADSLTLQASLGVEGVVWNAEIPGSEDYTDGTMQRIANSMMAKPDRMAA